MITQGYLYIDGVFYWKQIWKHELTHEQTQHMASWNKFTNPITTQEVLEFLEKEKIYKIN